LADTPKQAMKIKKQEALREGDATFFLKRKQSACLALLSLLREATGKESLLQQGNTNNC